MPVLFDSSSSPTSFSSELNGFKDGEENVPCRNYINGIGVRILGAGLLCCVVVLLVLRKRKTLDSEARSRAGMSPNSAMKGIGKGRGFEEEKTTAKRQEYQYGYGEEGDRTSEEQQRTLFETNLTNVRNLQSIPASPLTSSSSTYPIPQTQPQSQSASERMSESSGTATDLKIDIPRRRSYTKTVVSGGAEVVEVEVNGEIVVSPEGWRRHTRVFGGGVCKACEESERRLSA